MLLGFENFKFVRLNIFQDITMSDAGFAKACFNLILDSLVLPGNTNNHLTMKTITSVGPPMGVVPSVSSSLGRNNARNFEVELEEQENLGVITDNPWKELDTDLSQASEIKLIDADFTFKLLNQGLLYIHFT